MMKWSEDGSKTKDYKKFIDHVWDKESKLLNEWWDKRFEVRAKDPSAGDKMQETYVKKLAKSLGLPMTEDTYYTLKDMFINYDD